MVFVSYPKIAVADDYSSTDYSSHFLWYWAAELLSSMANPINAPLKMTKPHIWRVLGRGNQCPVGSFGANGEYKVGFEAVRH